MSKFNVVKVKAYFERVRKNVVCFVKNCPYFSLILLSILAVILMDCSEWFALVFFIPFILFVKHSVEKLTELYSERKQVNKILQNETIELQKDISDLVYLFENMKKDKNDPFSEERKEIIDDINESLEKRIEKFKNIISLYDK